MKYSENSVWENKTGCLWEIAFENGEEDEFGV